MANDSTPPNVYVFVSYASEDDPIAVQLANTLKSAFGPQMNLFLDKRSIRAGQKIPDTIAQQLEKADILTVVATGIGRPSHDWGGWEIGYFERAHKERPGTIVFLCLKEHLPPQSDGRKYVSLEIDGVTLEDSIEVFKRAIGEGQDSPSGVRNDDAMLGWLGDIGKALELGDIEQNADLQSKYKRHAAAFKLKIFEELKERVKKELKPQKQLLFRYNTGDPKKPITSLPEDTKITPKGGAMTVFGLPQNDITWGAFRNAVRSNPLGNFWCGALERIVLSAAGAKEVNVDSSQLIASSDPAHLYRLLLTTGTAYYNNQMDVSVYLVDFYRRRDYGDPKTSLLLKALQLVSRYRFMFLEDQSEFHFINIGLADPLQLPDLARRIVGELDLLTSDMFVSDLQLPATWGQFVPLEAVQDMHNVWKPLDDKLRCCCDAIVVTVVEKSADKNAVDDSKRLEELLRERKDLSDSLKECREKILPYNTQLLTAMAQKLLKIAENGGAGPKPGSPTSEAPPPLPVGLVSA